MFIRQIFCLLDQVLSANDLSQMSDQIMEESSIQQDFFHLVELGLVQFFLLQVLNFQIFVKWCAQQHFETQNYIMS